MSLGVTPCWYVSHHITRTNMQGLIPNVNETIVLNILTEGQFDALVLEDTPLTEEFLFPPTPDPVDIGLPPLRRRRQAENGGMCELCCVITVRYAP